MKKENFYGFTGVSIALVMVFLMGVYRP